MKNYNYTSYCQRPDEFDLSIYQLPGSPVHSPVNREQHFLQELRNLRAGIANQASFHEVPIALSPSFNATRVPSLNSLHRTFSDSNVILTPQTHLSRNGREDPRWMTNPPPPFSSFRPPEGYNSLERGVETTKAPLGRPFFKCASPTPWQSSDNLIREERSPRQRFFSPGPRHESQTAWEPDQTHWERPPEERREWNGNTGARNSKWENNSNNPSFDQRRTFEYPRWENNPEVRRETSKNGQWETETPQSHTPRRSEWEQQHLERQIRPRDLSLTKHPNWERESAWGDNRRREFLHNDSRQEPVMRNEISQPRNDWIDQETQHRQQVQRDLLQEIQQHRQQAARMQPLENQFVSSEPSQKIDTYSHRPRDLSLSRNPEHENSWRQLNSPLTPLYENRASRRSEWEANRDHLRDKDEERIDFQEKNGYGKHWNQGRPENEWNNFNSQSDTRSFVHQDDFGRVQNPMSRSQEYARGGFFAQAPATLSNRAMTEPRELGMLDRAMQNKVSNDPFSHTLGPELEMDVTVTHSSYRNNDGRTVPTSPQRHSYAGTFSEFSRHRNDAQQFNHNSYPRTLDNRPKSLNYESLSSVASSPAVSPPSEPFGRSLPTSPIQRSASFRYNTRGNGDPMWELDNIYGLAEQRAQRCFTKNQEVAQRSIVTTPVYGRGTLNERQTERASVERTTAVVNPLIVEPQPKPSISKHTGILLNPNEVRKTNKRRVMFLCDHEEADDFYQKNFGSADAEAPAHVKSYDVAIEDPLSRFSSLSEQIGGDVAVVAKKFIAAMDLHRNFLWQAASQSKPSNDIFQKLFQPLLESAQDITAFKDSKRQSPLFNHLNVIAEGTPALGWVTVEKTPAPYIKETLDSAMFYVNRILKDYKDKDQKHVDWVKSFQDLMKELQTFVRQTHTTGLVWNSAPGNAPSSAPKPSSAPAPPAGPSGGPPPPPPPPPANLFADLPKASAPSSDKAGRDALFAELNKGEGITSGLKKVTADMQTHKNPNLRSSSTVPSGPATSSLPSTGSPARAVVQKPPRLELENGKQWSVEFYNGNKNIIVEITDKKQSVYIYKCDNSVVQVKGKCNSVALDSCKKTAVVLDGVVAQCETINCQSVQIQTMGDMPTLSIQKTDGCQVYLSESSKNCEIVTSKSSEMNVLVPDGADGEFIELPLPEQFKTVYQGGKLVTTVSDI